MYAVNPDEDVLHDAVLKRMAVDRRGDTVSTAGTDDLVELFAELRVEEVTDFLCMCTGDYVIEFFDERNTLTELVRVDVPSRIQSRYWPGQARVADEAKIDVFGAVGQEGPESRQELCGAESGGLGIAWNCELKRASVERAHDNRAW